MIHRVPLCSPSSNSEHVQVADVYYTSNTVGVVLWDCAVIILRSCCPVLWCVVTCVVFDAFCKLSIDRLQVCDIGARLTQHQLKPSVLPSRSVQLYMNIDREVQ